MNEKGRILRRGHGFQLDHIGLAVPDTAKGVAFVEEKTGATPHLGPPQPGNFYWSGALSIGKESYLEIIGPNPDHRGVHPFKSVMAGLSEPTLMFWYVATDDFEAFAKKVENASARLQQIVRVDAQDDQGADYTRAIIGPGFLSQRPSVIEWRRRSIRSPVDIRCTLKSFSLSLRRPKELNSLFAKLGVDTPVHDGPSGMSITVDTPKGEIEFTNAGYNLTPMKMLAAVLKRPLG
ncbi:MAG: VOC family protein [Pseudomonadota bacterium]